MATLQATTIPILTATTISSPITTISSGETMRVFSGSIFLNEGASVDILTNFSGYSRTTGELYVFFETSGSWRAAIWHCGISRYGLFQSQRLNENTSSTLSFFQNPANVSENRIRFTNSNSGTSFAVCYMTLIMQNCVSMSSPLPVIK